MLEVQLPVCRPDQEKTVTVQKHLHCLRLLFNHTTSVHSDHFAHVWPTSNPLKLLESEIRLI